MAPEINAPRQVRYYLNEDSIEYIEDHKFKKGFGTNNTALNDILIEHKELSIKLFDLQYIVEQLKKELLLEMKNGLHETVAEEMKRIRLGTNNTDRNSQILIELIQGLMVVNNVKAITTTSDYKPGFLEQAEKIVNEKIINQKQKKHS